MWLVKKCDSGLGVELPLSLSMSEVADIVLVVSRVKHGWSSLFARRGGPRKRLSCFREPLSYISWKECLASTAGVVTKNNTHMTMNLARIDIIAKMRVRTVLWSYTHAKRWNHKYQPSNHRQNTADMKPTQTL